jgi:hypothetical protein
VSGGAEGSVWLLWVRLVADQIAEQGAGFVAEEGFAGEVGAAVELVALAADVAAGFGVEFCRVVEVPGVCCVAALAGEAAVGEDGVGVGVDCAVDWFGTAGMAPEAVAGDGAGTIGVFVVFVAGGGAPAFMSVEGDGGLKELVVAQEEKALAVGAAADREVQLLGCF